MKICYTPRRFGLSSSLDVVESANRIIVEHQEQGFDLTLRQLYYQFVAHDVFPDDRRWKYVGSKWVRDDNGTKNATPNYMWLGQIVNHARLAGLIDWNSITDRTRNLRGSAKWGVRVRLYGPAPRSSRSICGRVKSGDPKSGLRRMRWSVSLRIYVRRIALTTSRVVVTSLNRRCMMRQCAWSGM